MSQRIRFREFRFEPETGRLWNGEEEIRVTPRAAAVLDLLTRHAERDQDYFCEGLAAELIDALTHVEGLRVASRSTSFQFRGPAVNVRDVGRQLRVGVVLEGSVRKSGDRLRITVQLVDTASGYQRWSQRFERPMGDVFAIQDEIAESVATTLRGEAVSDRERYGLRRPETGTAPYECYLRGRHSPESGARGAVPGDAGARVGTSLGLSGEYRPCGTRARPEPGGSARMGSGVAGAVFDGRPCARVRVVEARPRARSG